jgi:hypothetical protein
MTDSGNTDWRGRRTKPSEPTSVDGLVPDWKQRKQTTPIPVRKSSLIKRLIVPIAILTVLVAGGIRMYIVALRQRTHFVVTELLSVSKPSDQRNFDTTRLPEFPARGWGSEGLQYTSISEKLTSRNEKREKEKIGSHDVVILYVQALLSPATQNDAGNELVQETEPQFLIETNSPDLNAENTFGLSRLKELVDQLRQQCKTGLLLILDFPDHPTTWRLGLPRAAVSGNLLKQIEAWTAEPAPDERKLVALVACGAGQISTGASIESFGRTAFAEAVTRGFSTDADVHPQDGQLTVAEFAEFVDRETGRLVAGLNRDGTQQVRCFSRGKVQGKNEKETGDFILLKELTAPLDRPQVTSVSPSATDMLSKLSNVSSKRDLLQSRLAFRWNPLAWSAAWEYLWRAEQLYLNGNFEEADDRLSAAYYHLELVKKSEETCVKEPSKVVAESVLDEINTQWINQLRNTLPLAAAGFSEPASSGDNTDTASEIPVSPDQSVTSRASSETVESSEKVLMSSFEKFPFDAIALKKPSPEHLQSILKCSRDVEQAFESLLGGPEVIEQTLLQLHRKALLQTDCLFVSLPPDKTAKHRAGLNETMKTADAVAKFAGEWRKTEFVLHDALSRLSGDIRWAAGIRPDTDLEWNEKWIDFLVDLVRLSEISQDECRHRCNDASKLAIDSDSASTFGISRLQGCILNVTISARGLYQLMRSLDSDVSREKRLNSAQLIEMTGKLKTWRDEIQESLRKLDEEASSYTDLLLATEGDNNRQKAVRLLRGALLLSSLRNDKHKKVLEKVQAWETELRKLSLGKSIGEAGRTTEREGSENSNPAGTLTDCRLQAAWMMQLFGFLPHAEDSQALKKFDISKIDAANVERQMAAAVRKSWRNYRNEVLDVLKQAQSTKTPRAQNRRLREAFFLSHLLTAFDVDKVLAAMTSQNNPADSLIRWSHFAYCRCHAEKWVQDRWIRVQDNKKRHVEETWYGEQVVAWINAAADVLEPVAPNTNVQKIGELDELNKRMLKEFKIEFKTDVQPDEKLDLTEENASPGVINVTTTYEFDDEKVSAGSVRNSNDAGEETAQAALTMRLRTGALPPTENLVEISDNAKPLFINPETAVYRTEFNIKRTPTQQSNNCGELTYFPHVFLRGREWESADNVRVDPCEPASIFQHFLARKSTAEIRVDGQDIRPIVFILDWSASMTDPVRKTGKVRYKEALEILNELADGDKVLPPDTPVILKVYGHRAGTDRNSGETIINPDYVRAFDVQPKGVVPLKDYENIFATRGMDPKSSKVFRDTIAQLSKTLPWGTTPLASAIIDSLNNDLDNESGIVIAITDGEAKDVGIVVRNDFPQLNGDTAAQDKAVESKQRLNNINQENLKKAVDENQSKVSIIAFDLQEKGELEALRDVFKGKCGIDVVDAASSEEVLKKIKNSMPERSWHLSGINVKREENSKLGDAVKNLEKGSYTVSFGKNVSAPFSLLEGDSLKLEVNTGSDAVINPFKFIHPVNTAFSEADATRVDEVGDPSQLLLLRCSLPDQTVVINGQRQYRPTLELVFSHPNDHLPVRRPMECHFEFSTQAQTKALSRAFSERPKNIYQNFTSEEFAPGYFVTIDSWPADKNIFVDAWWKMNHTEPDVVIPGSELVKVTSRLKALKIGGSVKLRPTCNIWTAKLADGTITEIRIVQEDASLYDPDHAAENVIVQLGRRGTLGRNETFLPMEVNTDVQQLENGSVIYRFSGLKPSEGLGLEDLDVAFTSLASIKKDAVTLKVPLEFKTPAR